MTHANRPEKIASILDAIAKGQSLRKACEAEGVDHSTFLMWSRNDAELANQYARAMEARADAMFEEMLEVADDARNDWMERHGDEDAGWQANGEHIQRSKLRVDARKWALARMNPRKYGDRIEIDATHRVTVAEEPLSPDEWEGQFAKPGIEP